MFPFDDVIMYCNQIAQWGMEFAAFPIIRNMEQGPFLLTIFSIIISNSIEISFCCNYISDHHTAQMLYSTFAVSYAEVSINRFDPIRIRSKMKLLSNLTSNWKTLMVVSISIWVPEQNDLHEIRNCQPSSGLYRRRITATSIEHWVASPHVINQKWNNE